MSEPFDMGQLPSYNAACQNSLTAEQLDRYLQSGRPVFVYGSLMFPHIIRGVIDRDPTDPLVSAMTPAVLPGYTRHALLNRDYPGVVQDLLLDQRTESRQAYVEGMLICGLSGPEKELIDLFESGQYEKRAVSVTISLDDGRMVPLIADVYIWTRGASELVPTSVQTWTVEEFTQSVMCCMFLPDEEESR